MITDLYGDLNVWLDTKIEQTVKEQKTFTIGTAVLEPIREMEALTYAGISGRPQSHHTLGLFLLPKTRKTRARKK